MRVMLSRTAFTRIASLLALPLAGAAISCSSSSTPSSTTQADYTVQVSNNKYTQANLTIKKGQTVQWVWVEGTHDVTSGTATIDPATMKPTACKEDGKFTSGLLSSGATWSYTFNDTGTFPYFCTPHCTLGQIGTITVQ